MFTIIRKQENKEESEASENCHHGVSLDDECLHCLKECAEASQEHFRKIAERCRQLLERGETNYIPPQDAE